MALIRAKGFTCFAKQSSYGAEDVGMQRNLQAILANGGNLFDLLSKTQMGLILAVCRVKVSIFQQLCLNPWKY